MNIIGNFVLEFGRSDDDNSTNNFANIRFTTGKPDSVEFTMVEDFFTKNFFTNRNLKNQTLARVERNHNIIIEKTSTGSGGVVVGRGT